MLYILDPCPLCNSASHQFYLPLEGHQHWMLQLTASTPMAQFSSFCVIHLQEGQQGQLWYSFFMFSFATK